MTSSLKVVLLMCVTTEMHDPSAGSASVYWAPGSAAYQPKMQNMFESDMIMLARLDKDKIVNTVRQFRIPNKLYTLFKHFINTDASKPLTQDTSNQLVEQLTRLHIVVDLFTKRSSGKLDSSYSSRALNWLKSDLGVSLQALKAVTPGTDLTSLHIAATGGSFILTKLLIARQANINAIDHRGQTPLHIAVTRHDRVEVVGLLLNNRANIEALDLCKGTALHLAVYSKSSKIVKLLLDSRANAEASDLYKCTALHLAVAIGDKPSVQLLLNNRANTEALDGNDQTPVMIAMNYNREDVLGVLQLSESNPNTRLESDELKCADIADMPEDDSENLQSLESDNDVAPKGVSMKDIIEMDLADIKDMLEREYELARR